MAQINRKSAKSGEGMDEDTKEILEEMEAEGFDTSTLNEGTPIPGISATTEENKEAVAESEEESEDDESKEETAGENSTEETEDDESEESEEEDTEEESEKDTESEADDEEEETEDDESEEDEEGQPKGKSLVERYRREKKLRKDAETALANIQSAQSDVEFERELKAFAKEAGMNEDVAKKFLDLAAKRSGLPKDLMADLQKSRQERRHQEFWKKQSSAFERDFRGNVIPALRGLGASDEQIQSVYKTLNANSKSPLWAWASSNKSKSLVELAIKAVSIKGNRVTSEGGNSRGHSHGKSAKELDEMSPEDIDEMSDEEFDKWSDKLGKQSKSRIHRS